MARIQLLVDGECVYDSESAMVEAPVEESTSCETVVEEPAAAEETSVAEETPVAEPGAGGEATSEPACAESAGASEGGDGAPAEATADPAAAT